MELRCCGCPYVLGQSQDCLCRITNRDNIAVSHVKICSSAHISSCTCGVFTCLYWSGDLCAPNLQQDNNSWSEGSSTHDLITDKQRHTTTVSHSPLLLSLSWLPILYWTHVCVYAPVCHFTSHQCVHSASSDPNMWLQAEMCMSTDQIKVWTYICE